MLTLRKFKYTAILFTTFIFVFSFNLLNVSASTLDNTFRVKMPNGGFKYLTVDQAGLHRVNIDASNGGSGLGSLGIHSIMEDGVCVETPTSVIGGQSVQTCRSNVGCNFATWGAPFLKTTFDVRTIGIQDGVAGNIRGSNADQARWVGSINSICPQGGGEHCNSNYLKLISTSKLSDTAGAFLDKFPDGTAFSMIMNCLLYTSPSPRDRQKSRMPSSA